MLLLPYLLLILFIPAVAAGQNITGNLEVHYIDVGQGDAALVMTPNRGCVMLVDSGGDSFYPSSAKMFRDYLTNILPFGHKIDLVVSSHPHSDHIGTMLWVLQKYKVKTYIDNGHQRPRVNANGNKTVYGKLMDEIDHQVAEHALQYFAHNEATSSGQDFCPQASNLDSELIFPSTGYPAGVCDSNPNNCSVLVKIRYADTTFLFVGDAEHEQEQILVQDEALKARLKAHVLKAPHHGSDTSSTIAFLEAVSPEWIVISSGKKKVGTNDSFKHPRRSTVTNFLQFVQSAGDNERFIDVYDGAVGVWAMMGISGRLYVTAKDSSIILFSDGAKISRK